jgi:hypothetical protein
MPDAALVTRFLKRYARRLEAIAAPESCDVPTRVVWRAGDGWKDPIDCERRIERLGELTEQWVQAFSALGEALVLAGEKREAKEIAWWVKQGWQESQVPGLRPRK